MYKVLDFNYLGLSHFSAELQVQVLSAFSWNPTSMISELLGSAPREKDGNQKGRFFLTERREVRDIKRKKR